MTTSARAIPFPPPRAQVASASVYLFHPVVDLAMVCGGWLVMLVMLNYLMTGGRAVGESIPPGLRVMVLVGTFIVAQPHSMATLFKLYGDKAARQRHRFVSLLFPFLLFWALIAALYIPTLARLQATVYVALALHHVMAQSYGIALMYCARAGLKVTSLERLLLQTLMWSAIGSAGAQQLSADFVRHAFMGVDLYQTVLIPGELVTALQLFAATAMAALLALQARRFCRAERPMPLPAVLTLSTTLVLMTVWNASGELVWIFVPAFFHGSQYLCVTMAYFLKKERAANQARSCETGVDCGLSREDCEFIALRLTELFVSGLLLFVGIPKLLSFSGAPFALCTSLMFFAISFHHFAADACIWKLRDPRVRRSLSH